MLTLVLVLVLVLGEVSWRTALENLESIIVSMSFSKRTVYDGSGADSGGPGFWPALRGIIEHRDAADQPAK